MVPDQQRSSIMSMYDPRRLTDAELAEVNGGVTASTMAYIHAVFSASASDLIFGGKGFVAEVAYDVAKGYR
jgi:hypothetical protein